MEFRFSEDQLLFRSALKDMLKKACTGEDVAAAWEQADGRIPGMWGRLVELGVVGLTVPERAGGLGFGPLEWVGLLEEAGYAALPEPLADTLALAAPLLEACAPAETKDALLGRLAAGELRVAVGLNPDDRVDGAWHSDLLLAEHEGELFAFEPAEVDLIAERSVDGSRRPAAITLSLGEAAWGAWGPEANLAVERARSARAVAQAAELCGLARRALDLTVEYAKVRTQFGKPIGAFQAVQHHLASALVPLELCRPLVWRAAEALVVPAPDHPLLASMAKVQAAHAADACARAALQVHGAIGYTVEYELHLWLKRIWALSSEGGDAGWHRRRVAECLRSGDAAERWDRL